MLSEPYILEETEDFAVVFKPPKMHSVVGKEKSGGTLVEWFAGKGQADSSLADGGLMHRLDFETHGLVLFAKNSGSFEFFKELQDKGEFVKEYSAVCVSGGAGSSSPSANSLPGFPPAPVFESREATPEKPIIISSYFRPFGPGRKEVRPVTNDFKKHDDVAMDRGGFYRTEIIGTAGSGKNRTWYTLRIKRGFRHQIRCHLCWIGGPILGDSIYSPASGEPEQVLALRAHGLFFNCPSGGGDREYRLDPLGTTDYADLHG
jgi:23S rRNA pseudouridine1911/1915/1917 synthase